MSAHCPFSAKCCRICSAECENIQNIFEITEIGKRPVDMLEFCLQHPIDTSDCFPKSICIECITNLIQTYQFFVLFKKSEEYFVSLYQTVNEMTTDVVTNNIKIESIELPEINEVLIKSELPGMDVTTATDLLEEAVEVIRPANSNNINVQQILLLSQKEIPNRYNDDDNDNDNRNPLLVFSEFCDQQHSIGQPKKKLERPHKRTSIQKQFECFDCKDTSFADYKDLIFHMRNHLDYIEKMNMNDEFVFDNVIIDDGIKYHVCEVCGNSYTGNKKLYQHRFNVHPNRTKPKNKGVTIVKIAGNEPVQRNICDRECFMCNLKFSKKSMLDEHLQTHTKEDEKKYMARKSVCSICGKRYVNNSRLHKHMRSHTGERPFECICGGRFIDRACLKKHMRICPSHTLIPIVKKPLKSFEERFEFDCKLCNRRFRTQECAQKHSETHTEEDEKLYNQRKYQCNITECSKRFRERLFLERHMLIHTREQPHQCESCNTRYSDISSLKKHLKNCAPHLIKVKPEGPFKCPHCSSGLFTVRGWLTHKSSHTDLIHDCEYDNCTESFRSTAEIRNHAKTVHAHELKNFQCDKCSSGFPLKYLLDAHIDRHKQQSEHLCNECGKVCLTSGGLTSHKKNAHSDERPIACEYCPQRFKEISKLKNHMTIHSGIKRFQCDICLKLFGHRSGLRNHKRTHTGERNFVCEESNCHKSFYSKSVLIKHMRIHTGERPYKCDHCDRAFTQRGDMIKHMLIHLGPTPHKCSECDKSFRLITELRKHSYLHYKPSSMD